MGGGYRVVTLSHDRLPIRPHGIAGIDGDQAAARGVEIGLEPEDRTVVVDELISSVEFVQQLDNLRVRLVEILVGITST
jgi:hypothetical protein